MKGVEELRGDVERVPVDAVVDPAALAAAVEQSGAVEHAQVLRDLRLRCADRLLEMTRAHGSTRSDVRHEFQTQRMGQRAQDLEGHVARQGNDAGLSDRQEDRLARSHKTDRRAVSTTAPAAWASD